LNNLSTPELHFMRGEAQDWIHDGGGGDVVVIREFFRRHGRDRPPQLGHGQALANPTFHSTTRILRQELQEL